MSLINSTLNILVVDDDEDDFFIISSLLNEIKQYSFNISWSPSYKSALNLLQNQSYNIVFADYRLGVKTGAQLIEEAIHAGIDIPIILLTGKGNAEVDKNAMEKGAYDYLIKSDITSESLERSIRYALIRYKSIKALQKSENKYRTMFENSKDGMFTLNESFEIIDINNAGLEILGLSRDAVSGKPAYNIVQNGEDIIKKIQLIKQTYELVDEELELITLEGEEHQGLLTVTPEKDADGKMYFQGVYHDITEFKKAEQANLLAEKFEATQRFIKMLAHEIRNPLNNIMLSIDSIMHDDLANIEKTYIDIVKRNSIRINDLISQLFESFKFEGIELRKINLKDLIQDALISVYDRLTLKKVSLKKEMDEPATIKADEEKLKLALINFLVNAIEAIQHPNGVLTIATKEKKTTIDLIISDNGCGMNEAQVQRLFEPYFTTKKSGLGLGLSTAMAILRSHNASVEVESEVNKGTKFTISFPK